MPEIRDAGQRERALDPTRSFIVQAPAGSGKTELLIQRYLTLLAYVDNPESVVAITFTRKAAGEMWRRVLKALEAAGRAEPDKPHEAATWRLARAVRERDAALGWDLVRNSSRMRIRTIDSLCDSLVRRMPWLSRLGAPPQIIEMAAGLYQEAARRTIDLVEDPTHGPNLERVLLHLDNDYGELTEFLAAMLARRDQWLRHLGDFAQARKNLEDGMRDIIREGLAAVRDAAPASLETELPALARYAAGNLAEGHATAACAGLRDLPGATADDIPAWLGIAEMLLTKEGNWRRSPDARNGFPAGRPEKRQVSTLLTRVAEDSNLRERLHSLRLLPPAVFEEGQWTVLEALIPVLKIAAAELRLVFRERGETDFIELALAADQALGGEDEPTDLALALDYRIQHLLVDEFQDTSVTQFKLIEKLVAGWEPGDGRTLFLVGDPMQSIFRFREAEVGLFLEAARSGIGPVRLEALRLEMNFRSEQGIVDWVNDAFPAIFPGEDDPTTGAVRFAPSSAIKPGSHAPAVSVHAFFGKADEAEAARVVEIAGAHRDAGEKVAVLVRARTHLISILRALRRAGLAYRAVEIDELGELAITQDLLALTRALLHPADRVAWLAILRAPWCGLTLADLHALAADAPKVAIWDLIHDEARLERLSEDGRRRLKRTVAALEDALARRGERLRPWIESCWTALGGPACATEPGECENALAFLDLLERLDEGGDASLEALADEAGRLFAGADPTAGDWLEVMTIHKAKGLEFEVVILPGLGRSVRGDDPRLLAWLERPSASGRGALLLAPVKAAGAKSDQLYDYVKSIEKQKGRHEDGRLLYVAMTRAKKQLHLLGTAARSRDRLAAGGLLGRLWPAVRAEFESAERAVAPEPEGVAAASPIPPAPLRRLPAGWSLPAPPPSAPAAAAGTEAPSDEPPTYEWVGDTLRHIGTVVHQALALIAREGAGNWAGSPVETALRTLGVPEAELAGAAATVRRAVASTLADARGRWILDRSHADARSEYPVNGVVDGRTVGARVDRTFVDADGVRWIIDFKTSEHTGGDREEFLDSERERYRKQMSGYRALFRALNGRTIRMGLYFPLLAGWREYLEAATA